MIKKIIDIIAVSTALIVFSPVYATFAYKVKNNLGSPVLFRQTRPGLNGQPFEMIKFRTLKDAFDAAGNLLSEGERLTSFGKMLRSSLLDELPKLWNVVKGGISLVGPRPLSIEYLPLYNKDNYKI